MRIAGYRRWHVHSRLAATVHTQASPDGWHGMPTCGFCRTGCSYGLSRSRQRFLVVRRVQVEKVSQPVQRVEFRLPYGNFPVAVVRICRLTPNTPCQPLIFCVARSPRRRRSAAASFPSGAVRTGVSSAYSRCACPFSGLVMVSVGAGAFRSLQSMAAPVRSTSNPSQNMACGWLNWMYSPEWRVLPCNAYTKV